MNPARILIVDDEAPARARMRDLLDDCREAFPLLLADEAANGKEALEIINNSAIDIVLLDIRMPVMDGIETARHLALWMTYEDTIRVAALKTRATRFERVLGEAKVKSDQLLAIDEYLHPRLQEIVETLPAGLGRWLERTGWARRVVERRTQRGRVVTTSSLGGFLLLYGIAGLRRYRRSSLRFTVESERIESWLAAIAKAVAHDAALALEVVHCQRLVKGYGDTHERGWKNFTILMGVVAAQGTALAPATLRTLREAALADEHGHALAAALRVHAAAVPPIEARQAVAA